MMADIRVLLGFAALLCMALFYMRLGVRSCLAPLCAVGTVSLGLSLLGTLGLLRLGGWLLYLFAALCAGLAVWQAAARKKALPRPGFGFWFFVGAGLVLILLLWAKQPLFTGWDEFSLWGTAAKLMKLNDELYTTAPSGWIWPTSQKPAYIAFGYFFQFFGADFVEWQTYAACDIFQLAMMASLFAPFEGALGPDGRPRPTWPLAVPVALIALLTPFVFQHYQTADSVSPAYLDTLGDIPLGLCFAAALACGLGAKAGQKASFGGLAPPAMALALTTLTKDTGFALALVAAVILAADWLASQPAGKGRGAPKKSALAAEDGLPGSALPAAGGAPAAPAGSSPAVKLKKRRAGAFALRLGGGLALVLALFIAWEVYSGALSGQSRLDSAVTTGGVGMLEMPFAFLRDLANPSGMTAEKQAVFSHVTGGMVQLFLTARGNMLGSGLFMALLCLGMLGVAALVYQNKAHRRRVGVFALLSTLGFAAWYWLLAMTYIYVFRPDQALTFESYDRYVYPYYIGWMLGSLVLLCAALVRGRGRLCTLGQGAVLGFAALLLLKVALLVPTAYTVWGVNPQEYSQRRAFNTRVDKLKQQLDPEGRTFLVMSGDTGIGWFMYHHQLLPRQLDYSYGGGQLVVRQAQPDGTTRQVPVTPQMLSDHLVETGCTTLFIDFADHDFIQTYGELFSDGLASYQEGKTSLYAVQVQGDAAVLEPVL